MLEKNNKTSNHNCVSVPPSATNKDQNITFDHIFLWQSLLFWQNNYIYFFKKCHKFWVMTNSVNFTFLGKCHCTNFFRENCWFAPKTKKMGVSFIWKLKAKKFQNTLDLHYDQKIWGRNDFANLDSAVLLPKKNALFALLWNIRPFLTIKKWKHCFKWPTPLEWYNRDSLLSLVLGCQHI